MVKVRASESAARAVRVSIGVGEDRLWSVSDFADFPPAAVATALSRLSREGVVQRVAKGVYYRPGLWLMGETRPKSNEVILRSLRRERLAPAGLSAANALGLTTQNPALPELAIVADKIPVALRGNAIVRTSRPIGRRLLPPRDAALLEVLRDSARTSDLAPDETIERLVSMLRPEGILERLVPATIDEPPRVRAMLGALAEAAGAPADVLARLRQTLNPLSRFDFGALSGLSAARSWQARSPRR